MFQDLISKYKPEIQNTKTTNQSLRLRPKVSKNINKNPKASNDYKKH